MKRMLAVSTIVAMLASVASGSLVIGDAESFVYTQDFDTLKTGFNAQQGAAEWTDNSTIAGWWWNSNNSTRDPGAYGYVADRGNSTTGAGHSYGADASSERAMGVLTSSGTDIYIGVQFQNTSGSDIQLSNMLISYVGEQWRQNTGTQGLVFSYAISDSAIANTLDGSVTWNSRSALDFAPIHTATSGELDGNLAANQTSFDTISLNTTGTLATGDYLMLRWSKTGTFSTGLAVDDFRLEVIPEPGTMGLLLGAGGLLAVLRRRRQG